MDAVVKSNDLIRLKAIPLRELMAKDSEVERIVWSYSNAVKYLLGIRERRTKEGYSSPDRAYFRFCDYLFDFQSIITQAQNRENGKKFYPVRFVSALDKKGDEVIDSVDEASLELLEGLSYRALEKNGERLLITCPLLYGEIFVSYVYNPEEFLKGLNESYGKSWNAEIRDYLGVGLYKDTLLEKHLKEGKSVILDTSAYRDLAEDYPELYSFEVSTLKEKLEDELRVPVVLEELPNSERLERLVRNDDDLGFSP